MQHVINAVHFCGVIHTLADLHVIAFIEPGAQLALGGTGADFFAENSDMGIVAWFPSLVPGKKDVSVVLRQSCRVAYAHADITWPLSTQEYLPNGNSNRSKQQVFTPTPKPLLQQLTLLSSRRTSTFHLIGTQTGPSGKLGGPSS
ncbi:hypothetical protein BGZ60DRAFT_420629 [Tricladium varicosporioides]|nr:hypothetical protein BGZ60DRAFT_420629 [Hymenoscyphus varicosporioides]